jgi:hypothetical protein
MHEQIFTIKQKSKSSLKETQPLAGLLGRHPKTVLSDGR